MFFLLGSGLSILAVSALFVKYPNFTARFLKKVASWVGVTDKTVS